MPIVIPMPRRAKKYPITGPSPLYPVLHPSTPAIAAPSLNSRSASRHAYARPHTRAHMV